MVSCFIFLVIFITVKISQFIRFVLEQDILPHLDLQRGVPSTISMLVHYSILAAGFLIAISAAGFELDRLTTRGYSLLLRIERGRTRHREVFGPMRLHYGFFKLRTSRAEYLLARRNGRIVGAIGYMLNELEQEVRIFELISLDDQVIRLLLSEIERRCREESPVRVPWLHPCNHSGLQYRL